MQEVPRDFTWPDNALPLKRFAGGPNPGDSPSKQSSLTDMPILPSNGSTAANRLAQEADLIDGGEQPHGNGLGQKRRTEIVGALEAGQPFDDRRGRAHPPGPTSRIAIKPYSGLSFRD